MEGEVKLSMPAVCGLWCVCALLAHAVIAVNRTIDVYLILVNYCLKYIGSESAPMCVHVWACVCAYCMSLYVCGWAYQNIFIN